MFLERAHPAFLNTLQFFYIECIFIIQGETQAYTLGDIGGHRCVVTKLPVTGHTREVLLKNFSLMF